MITVWDGAAQVGTCSADPGVAGRGAACSTVWPGEDPRLPGAGTILDVMPTPIGLRSELHNPLLHRHSYATIKF